MPRGARRYHRRVRTGPPCPGSPAAASVVRRGRPSVPRALLVALLTIVAAAGPTVVGAAAATSTGAAAAATSTGAAASADATTSTGAAAATGGAAADTAAGDAATTPGLPTVTTTPGQAPAPGPTTQAAPAATPTTPAPAAAGTPAPATQAGAPVAAAETPARDDGPEAWTWAVLAGAIVLAALLGWALVNATGRIGWLAPVGHSMGEAGWRISLRWAEFRDWLRFGSGR